ncbi:patatin-like protein 6 [Syzygium oleosum]|uniref:patatin-like protein 6 n=1 Tax=Syzygium oleosum TaxID=219896 RepID=UPI0024B9B949|nr:patatin-like protein 6 [Syzygium oleosum]
MACSSIQMQEPSIETDKLSYEIFSILETNFLFGYGDHDQKKLLVPKHIPDTQPEEPKPHVNLPQNHHEVDAAITERPGKICILTIDGGGGSMRGLVFGKALAYLEGVLKAKSGNPDARIADYFDIAAGSGVGGILAAMLFATRDRGPARRPISEAEDTWRFLADKGSRCLALPSNGGGEFFRRVLCGGSGSQAASTATMEKAMKEVFSIRDGKDRRFLTLKDTVKPVLIPCYDLSTASPFLFSRADALGADSYNFRLWEVCLATLAEPGSFGPVEIRSVDGRTRCVAVDGGLAMSNPTAAAITHVLHNKRDFGHVLGVEDLLVLSIGTGPAAEPRLEYEKVRKWRAKEWARPVARITGDASADAVDQAVALAFGPCRSSNYLRIQANGSSLGQCGRDVDTDPSPNNVKMAMAMADDMLKQKNVESVLFGGKRVSEQSNYEKLDWFADELVQEHQRRSRGVAPTVAPRQAAPSPT